MYSVQGDPVTREQPFVASVIMTYESDDYESTRAWWAAEVVAALPPLWEVKILAYMSRKYCSEGRNTL